MFKRVGWLFVCSIRSQDDRMHDSCERSLHLLPDWTPTLLDPESRAFGFALALVAYSWLSKFD